MNTRSHLFCEMQRTELTVYWLCVGPRQIWDLWWCFVQICGRVSTVQTSTQYIQYVIHLLSIIRSDAQYCHVTVRTWTELILRSCCCHRCQSDWTSSVLSRQPDTFHIRQDLQNTNTHSTNITTSNVGFKFPWKMCVNEQNKTRAFC